MVPSCPFSPHTDKMLKQNSVTEFSTTRSSGCQDLWHTCSAAESLDFPFLSVWHLSEILAQLYFFQRVPLHTACMCVPAITLKYGEVTYYLAQLIPKLSLNWQHDVFFQCGLQIPLFKLDLSTRSPHQATVFLVTFGHSRAAS